MESSDSGVECGALFGQIRPYQLEPYAARRPEGKEVAAPLFALNTPVCAAQRLPVHCGAIRFGPLRSGLVRFDPVWSASIRFGPLRSGLVRFDPVRSASIRLGPL